MSRTLTIFLDFASQPARSIAWFVAANKIPAEIVQKRIVKGEHRAPEYLAVNPFGKIPAVKDVDGTCVWESHTIIRYLAAKYHVDPQWYAPAAIDLQRHLSIEQYLDFHHIGVRLPCAEVFRTKYLYPMMGQKVDPALVENAEKQYRAALRTLERSIWFTKPDISVLQPKVAGLDAQASAGPFILGSAPSVCDIFAFCEIEQCELMGVDFLSANAEQFPKIAAWYRLMHEVPGYDESHFVFKKLCAGAASKSKL